MALSVTRRVDVIVGAEKTIEKPQPISISEIKAYCDLWDLRDASARVDLMEIVLGVDGAYRELHARKNGQ